jgi:hypothetical protein
LILRKSCREMVARITRRDPPGHTSLPARPEAARERLEPLSCIESLRLSSTPRAPSVAPTMAGTEAKGTWARDSSLVSAMRTNYRGQFSPTELRLAYEPPARVPPHAAG